MSGGSLAMQRRELLKTNRARQLHEMRERLTELGDGHGLHQLDVMMAEYSATGTSFPDAPADAFLAELVQNAKDACADLGTSRTALNGLCAVALKRDDFSARMTRYTDGSGLVAVSDATFSLCGMYSEFIGLTGQRGPEPQVLTGLLRYYNTQQRVFGISGKLEIRLGPEAAQSAAVLFHLAAQFVVAHEIAHYALGHTSSVSAFAPDEYLPVCLESHQFEAEADLHALHVIRRTWEQLLGDLPPGSEQTALAAVGAAIGTLVVHVTERALFIRRGASHPPARQRAAALLREMHPAERSFAQEIYDLALPVTEAASSTGESIVPFSASMFGSAPIHTPLDPSYLKTTEVFDALQCRSWRWYLNLLDQAGRELRAAWLTDGAQYAAEGDAAAALRSWGVPKRSIGALCDPEQPLTFNTLRKKLKSAFTVLELQGEYIGSYSIAAAMLISKGLG